MLDQNLVAEVLRAAQVGGAEWAELFVEDTVTTTLTLLQGEVKDAGGGNGYGAGLRLLYGTRVVYGYTNDTSRKGLLEVARAGAVAGAGRKNHPQRGGRPRLSPS